MTEEITITKNHIVDVPHTELLKALRWYINDQMGRVIPDHAEFKFEPEASQQVNNYGVTITWTTNNNYCKEKLKKKPDLPTASCAPSVSGW